MNKGSIIYVAGHAGLLGSALISKLKEQGFDNVLTRTHDEMDLTDRKKVNEFFDMYRPEYVFLAAGKTGGIVANKTFPDEFLHVNIAIQDTVFEAAQKYKVNNLIFYGSSCMYPKESSQPIREAYLLTGKIEETSEAYAIAKMAGIAACKAYNKVSGTKRFIALVPNSMFGPEDNIDPDNSHVLSALIRKLHEASLLNLKTVTLWGTGNPRREFIYSEDVADASIFAMQNASVLDGSYYNIGTGVDYSIQELSSLIADVVGYQGEIHWDIDKPDGTARKLLDSSRFSNLGWLPSVTLEKGLEYTYEWYLKKIDRTEESYAMSS